MDAVLLSTGFLVGAMVGLTGVGGGALMTPALVLCGVPPATAVGTDLVYAAVTKSAGAVLHHVKGNVCWPVVRLMAIGSLPAAVTAIWFLGWLQERGFDYSPFVTTVLGIALLLTSVVIFLGPWLRRAEQPTRGVSGRWSTAAAGALIGALVAASSVGAGALGAALLLVRHRSLPAIRVVGTDLAHALMLAVVAGIGHWQLGAVDVGIVWPLLTGSLPGVLVGARLAGSIPESVLRPAMAVLLMLLGVGFSLGGVAN
ncbi:MAG: sulfite exporter TauE/SafE family protein [Proteobacteria bacterium]|nr:MAG: sulfite exporter TauE/SafE family protein [Pseudomonadota bacterium]